MNEIGLFVSSFGGMGLFIYYLLNRDKTTSKEQTDAIKKIGMQINRQGEGMDDLIYVISEFLDYVIPYYGKKRTTASLQERVEARKADREREKVSGQESNL